MRQIKPVTLHLRFDSDKKLFTLMLVVIVTITVDSQIGYIADFIPEQLSSSTGIAIFVGIAAIFVISQYLILVYIKQSNKETRDGAPHLHLLQAGVSISQYILAALIVLVILQILLIHEYSIIALYITYAISFVGLPICMPVLILVISAIKQRTRDRVSISSYYKQEYL